MTRTSRLLLALAVVAVAALLYLVDVRAWLSPPRSLEQGQAALRDGANAEAIRHFQAARERCESDIAASYLLGAAYHNYGWQDEALKEYQRTWLMAMENATRAMHSAARIWHARGDLARATTCYRQAIALDPNSPDIWHELGLSQLASGQPDPALYSLGQAAKLAPHNPTYREALQRAAESFRAVEATSPTNPTGPNAASPTQRASQLPASALPDKALPPPGVTD